MEINPDYKPAAAEAPNLPAESPAQAARPEKFMEGDVVKGIITDIQADQVTILTESGETVTAKLHAPIAAAGAKIGAMHAFTVRLDENGRLTLELRAPAQEAAQKNMIADALASFGMKPTEHNMKLAAILLENRQPLTSELMRTLNQAVKLLGPELTPETAEKAMFLIDNEISVNAKMAQTLNGLAVGQIKLAGQLAELARVVEAMPPSPLKDGALAALTSGEAALGEDAVIADALERAGSVRGGLEAKIMQAFAGGSLPPTASGKLGQALLAEYPEQRELIARLVAEKDDFVRFVADYKPALRQGVAELISHENLTPDTLATLVHGLREGAGPAGAPSAPKLGANEAAFLMNELLNELFPEGGPEADAARAALRLPGKEQPADISSVLARFSFKPGGADPKEIDVFLNTLRDNIAAAKTLLAQEKNASPETARVAEQLARAGDSLEFVAQAKNTLFAHLPLAMAEGEAGAELYVFRDKKRREDAGNTASALIALDTLNLGRFEVYVRKQDKQVDCQFRLRDEDVERLVRAHAPELSALLARRAFRLQGCSFRRLDEPFTLLSAEPGDPGAPPADARPPGSLSFDIRT